MNHIDKHRTEIADAFDESTFQKGEQDSFVSPSSNFRLETTNYFQRNSTWDLTKMEIYHEESGELLFDFFVNESQYFFEWLTVSETEYLICAEDIFGGQTVVDLTNRKMSSYSPNEDGFIWTDFHLSPDSKWLATIGCYWGSQYFIKIFDFSNPMELPLPEIREIELLDNDEVIQCWLNNTTLKMKGVQREREQEYDENGSFRMKILSEIPVERELPIHGKSLQGD
jgi:hypothetical protein